MRLFRVCALAGVTVCVAILSISFAPVQAADLGYGSIKDAPPPPSGRAWYLKGTIGMKNESPGSIWTDGGGNQGPGYQSGYFTVDHADIKSTAIAGLGIGVEVNRWLRFDVTGEYRGKQLFIAQDIYHGPGGPYTNEYTADLESWLGLFNVYIDLGTWRGLTPYVGGGIGVSSMEVQGFRDDNVVNSTTYLADNDKRTTNFAWALYAGVSYDVTPQFTVDLGYRYADLGSVETGRATDYTGANWYEGLQIRDITSNDLLLSMRYKLDQPQAVYSSAIK